MDFNLKYLYDAHENLNSAVKSCDMVLTESYLTTFFYFKIRVSEFRKELFRPETL